MNQTIRPRNIEGFFDAGFDGGSGGGYVVPRARLSTAVAPQVSEGEPVNIPRAPLMYGGQLVGDGYDYGDYGDNGGGDDFTDYRRDNFDGGFDNGGGDGGRGVVVVPSRAMATKSAPPPAPRAAPPSRTVKVSRTSSNWWQWIFIAVLLAVIIGLLARRR